MLAEKACDAVGDFERASALGDGGDGDGAGGISGDDVFEGEKGSEFFGFVDDGDGIKVGVFLPFHLDIYVILVEQEALGVDNEGSLGFPSEKHGFDWTSGSGRDDGRT